MRIRLVLLALLAIVAAACQGPPPTVVYVVLSPTPDATEAAQIAAENTPEMTDAVQPTAVPTSGSLPAVTPAATSSAAAVSQRSQTPNLTPTPLPSNFPTPVRENIQYAEQLFEHGRMFWLQPIGQIWVLLVTDEGRGTWTIYPDNFIEGDPESDPSLVPPSSSLQQPVRGFGLLWRENEDVRNALGWAVQPERGYVATYEYHAGGEVNASGEYSAAPGYHVIYSFMSERFRMNEADATWQLGG